MTAIQCVMTKIQKQKIFKKTAYILLCARLFVILQKNNNFVYETIWQKTIF